MFLRRLPLRRITLRTKIWHQLEGVNVLRRMSTNIDSTHYILPSDQPVCYLESNAAFKQLTEREKRYAYYLSKASWVGGLITLVQTSVESPKLFVFLHKFYRSITPEELRAKAKNAGLPDDDVNAFIVYAAGVFANAGNYKGFGDTKIIPGLAKARFAELVQFSPIWSELQPLWDELGAIIYDLSGGKQSLGFAPECTNTYFSKNCTIKDNDVVMAWMKSKKMEAYNNRLFKTAEGGKTKYQIRQAGEAIGVVQREESNGILFEVWRGDYSPLIGKCANFLDEAVKVSANNEQAQMLQAYAKSFREGTLDDHKKGSQFWVQDKGPAVENYIGFIETYRDPAGMRGEFEGFVAVVNKETSRKFQVLVDNAESFLSLLPWAKHFEKDQFNRPDFTSLDVITFSGSSIPVGINIPNYDEIRQNFGFKNVSLGNVLSTRSPTEKIPFLSASDEEIFKSHRIPAFEVQVGLHELLGHGSGKLFKQTESGVNFPNGLVDPLTGAPVQSYYKLSETYDSVFGPLGSAWEECRAECVGLYLCLEPSVQKIFGFEGAEVDTIIYANWMSMVWSGLSALEMWNSQRGWLQAHSQARHAILRVLLQAGIASITQPSANNLQVSINRNEIAGAGRNAIGHFLLQLNTCKATADVDRARNIFEQYTNMEEPWLSWRDIVLANKMPRKILTLPNLDENNGEIVMRNYDASTDGVIHSWCERFDHPEELYKDLIKLSVCDAPHY